MVDKNFLAKADKYEYEESSFPAGIYGFLGNHELEINELDISNNSKGVFFIADCTVVSSENEHLREGQNVSCMIKLFEEKKFFNDIRSFLSKVTGEDPESLDSNLIADCLGDTLAGQTIGCTVTPPSGKATNNRVTYRAI